MSHSFEEQPAEASRKPPFSQYFFRFSRSWRVMVKAPSPVMMTNGYWKMSSEETLTEWKRRLVEMADVLSARSRKWSLKHLEVLTPA